MEKIIRVAVTSRARGNRRNVTNKKNKQEDIMKKISSIILSAFILILWGCSKDTVPTESAQTDEQQIQAEILKIEESIAEDYFYSDMDEESENNFFK